MDEAHLRSLELFEEILDDLRRNASVVSRTPVTAIVMTSQDFRAMSREMPAVAERIRAIVAERTRALV